jgi:hypothetical protein
MASISLGVPLTPSVTLPPAPGVGPVTPAAPLALFAAEAEALPLPQALAPAAAGAADPAPDGAALRPDQVFMARQMTWPAADGATLAASWRSMVRNYGAQLTAREQQARAGQLAPALLAAGQDPRVLRQPDLAGATPADAWRFTVHTGGRQDRRLTVVTDEPDQPPGRRRRARAALRLELELADGTRVTVQADPLPDGIGLELCAPGARAMERLRELQPVLELAVARAGLRVTRWRFRDTLPPGQLHARLAASEAAAGLNLAVFRALAELALVLPAEG